MSSPLPTRQILGVAPHFFVSNIHQSVAYYRDVLGFACDKIWGEPPGFAMPRRDSIIVMLAQHCDKPPIRPNSLFDAWDAYFWVYDADELFDEFKSRGVLVHYEPCDQLYYGNREFAIKDPDGYVLAFAHDIESKRKRQSL